MIVRIASWILRVLFLLLLILGLVFWIGNVDAIVPVHMILGILFVLVLWVIAGTTAAARGGNWGLAGAAFVLGIIMIAFGLRQAIILTNSLHWIIQVIHLLLGLCGIGLGEAMTARYKRFNTTSTVAA